MRFETEKAAEILTQTPKTLRSLLGNLSAEWIYDDTDSDSWSAFDVVGHLIHGEETDWIPRAKIILDQGENIAFEPFDRLAQIEKSKGKSLSDLLNEFENLRLQNVEVLKLLNPNKEQMKLNGMHPELGKVTLEELLSTWVVHDLTHIRQIAVGFAQKYSKNVGPWKEYLSILNK